MHVLSGVSTLDVHGMSVADALRAFLAHYNDRIERGERRSFVVVHGYGASGEGGRIRGHFRRLIAAFGECCVVQFGEALDNNPGYTVVTPRIAIPEPGGLIAADLLVYCETPRTIEKISGEFRRYGDQVVRAGLRDLEKRNAISVILKGKYKCYQAVIVKSPQDP